MKFAGKSVLVTGAGGGIGAEVCAAFAREGAAIIINDVQAAAAEKTAAACRALGAKAFVDNSDITRSDQADAMIKAAVDNCGSLDVLVNNAGITKDTLVVRMSDEDWLRVLNVNLTGAFFCARAAAKVMMKRRAGVIVNVSSVIGIAGNAGQANYAASKAGLIALTKSMAKELGSRGVRVMAVAPGFITTPMTSVLPDDVKNGILDRTSLRKFGEPKDVAAAILFLAGEESGFITGDVLRIDGGLTV